MKKAVIFDMYGVLLRRNFFLNEKEDTEMTALVRELKEKECKLFLLSNIFLRDSNHFKNKYQFLKLFDKLYFSSDIGFTKPDPRAYELVLKENNLEPADCIFFDDSQSNVAAANKLGIEAHLFKGAEATRKALYA